MVWRGETGKARSGDVVHGMVGFGLARKTNKKEQKMSNIEHIFPEDTYPMWEKVVERVRDLFEDESYGFIIEHAELKELMGIQPAISVNDVIKEQLDYLVGMGKAKDQLLIDYNLYLSSVQGHGYELLHPSEQIRKGADYYFKKSQKALVRTMNTLANVDSSVLDMESRNLQLLKMNRIAFLKAAYRKRKIPMQEKKKEIEK